MPKRTIDPATVQTRGVLGGAYRGRDLDDRARHTHAVECRADGSERALCGGVKPDNIADEYADDTTRRPTCPKCAERDPRTHGGR